MGFCLMLLKEGCCMCLGGEGKGRDRLEPPSAVLKFFKLDAKFKQSPLFETEAVFSYYYFKAFHVPIVT